MNKRKPILWIDKQSLAHASVKAKDQCHDVLIVLNPKDKSGDYLMPVCEVTDAPTAEQVFERILKELKSWDIIHGFNYPGFNYALWLESKRESILKGGG